MVTDPVAGFADALLTAPLGTGLLGVLEAGADPVAGWQGAATTTAPAAVDAAVARVASMSLGTFLDAAVYTGVLVTGPWISDAPSSIATAYRHADARRPIAEAVERRFGAALHQPLDRSAQMWWTDGAGIPSAPLFGSFDDVYGAGEFTWAGLWTATHPPQEAELQMVAAWEYEQGPVQRCRLPVRSRARVFEIHRPGDWAGLVRAHPRAADPHPGWELPGVNQRTDELSELATASGRRAARTTVRRHLVPDWASVRDAHDGVHLSWAGCLTSEGCVRDLGDGDVTMLRYWFSERTHWLADVFGEPAPAPGPAIDLSADQWPPRPHTEPSVPAEDVLTRLLGR